MTSYLVVYEQGDGSWGEWMQRHLRAGRGDHPRGDRAVGAQSGRSCGWKKTSPLHLRPSSHLYCE